MCSSDLPGGLVADTGAGAGEQDVARSHGSDRERGQVGSGSRALQLGFAASGTVAGPIAEVRPLATAGARVGDVLTAPLQDQATKRIGS